MNLKQRLRLMNAAGTRPSGNQSDGSHEHEVQKSAPEQVHIPGAYRFKTEAGDAICIETLYPLSTPWGNASLTESVNVPALGCQRLLGAEHKAETPESLRSAVILDTETTGLQRGAGTYAFLVGIGRFVEDGLPVRQFIMSDYDQELPQLHAVLEEIEDATALVTFNGKSFDWPLLQTRAVLNRIRLPQLPHIDLLHPARRLWRQVVPSCRLVQLETDILGVERQDDVPSELIPSIYFDFVRTRDSAPMLPVLEHNRFDIVSTAVLAGYLGASVAEPVGAAPMGRQLSGTELYGVGNLLVAQGQTEESIECLEAALERGMPNALRASCMELLGTLLKRKKQYERSTALWQEMIDEGLKPIGACVELAKYYEHVEKDLDAAGRYTMLALDILGRRRLLRGLRKVDEDKNVNNSVGELTKRLNRIELKKARAGAKQDAEFPA